MSSLEPPSRLARKFTRKQVWTAVVGRANCRKPTRVHSPIRGRTCAVGERSRLRRLPIVSSALGVIEGRLAASRERVRLLSEGFDDWLDLRRKADVHEQYSTQLDTIETVIHTCVDAVTGTITDDPAEWTATYEVCRLADRRAVWVERVWKYFSSRFDQRDGATSAATCLLAADEVLWSCWRPCFAEGPADPRPKPPGAVPLPYLDPVHAPEAFPATLVPSDLASSYADAPFVREHLSRLPVPTVRVPAASIHEPWLLGLIAHEAGHQIQFAAQLGHTFRAAVEGAVAKQGGDANAVSRWSDWSVELFADLASVAMLGPWALWPIAELELGRPQRMSEPRSGYPPGIVRLRLIEVASRLLGLDPLPAWPSAAAKTLVDEAALPDLAFAEQVAAAGLSVGPGNMDMASWIRLDVTEFGVTGQVQQWRRWYAGGPRPNTVPSLKGPRIALAGAVAASADARRAAPEVRKGIEARLADSAYREMVALRVKGKRAAGQVERVGADLGALATALLQADEAELDAVGVRP